MRHQNKKFILSRKKSARQALAKELLRSFILKQRLQTTLAKAKAMRPVIEKLITLAKQNDLTSRRRCQTILQSNYLVKKLFTDIAPLYKNRQGGYTRIIKVGYRKGDGAALATIELIKS